MIVHRYYAATTDDPDEIYAHAVKGLNAFPLAYLLLSEPRWTGRSDGDHVRRGEGDEGGGGGRGGERDGGMRDGEDGRDRGRERDKDTERDKGRWCRVYLCIAFP